jgi:SEC-C motif
MKMTASVILVAILFILGILLVLAIGGGLLALLAYGIGWVISRVTHLEPFQATVISLASILAFGILAERIWQAIISGPPLSSISDEEEDEFDFGDEYFDEDEEEDESVIYPGIPRWRQPLKTADFSNIKPDDRCPCGSGRKYKNCHGKKSAGR